MNLARKINEKLDDLSRLKKELENLSDPEEIACAKGVIEMLKKDLELLTNKGKNIRDVFTNIYYINDLNQK